MTEKFGPQSEGDENEFACRISRLSDCPDFMGGTIRNEQGDDFDLVSAPSPADKSGEYQPLSAGKARELLNQILLEK